MYKRQDSDGVPLQVGDVIEDDQANQMVNLNQGSQIFRNFRLSSPYLKKTKTNGFAMIKQMGTPTFFQSFSVADTKWQWYLAPMYFSKNKCWPTNKQISALSWEEKCDLLNHDHIKTAQIFQNMVDTLISHLKKPDCPLGVMTDYLYRIESQKRGKLHLHIISYHDGAPQYTKEELHNICQSTKGVLSLIHI